MKHATLCMVNCVDDPNDDDCTCGAVKKAKQHEQRRLLFNRTLTEKEIDTLIGPTGEGIEYDLETWKEMQRKSCGESTTE